MSNLMRLVGMMLVAILLLAACGAPAYVNEAADHAAEDSAGAESHAEATEAGAAPAEEATAEPTEAMAMEMPTAEPTEVPVAAEEAAVPAGDPVQGKEIFETLYPEAGFACATCHRVDSTEQLIGPGLLNVSVHGATHVPGLSAEEYIRQSIMEPNAYVVPNYPENLMPQVYAELFSAEQINDIIAYVMSLTD